MPVTSRRLQVYKVPDTGKKGPVNLRWDNVYKRLLNIECDCHLPQLPDPITIEYTFAGSYTDTLPSLPNGYVWQINGIVIAGGGGGGGGGGGNFAFGFRPGGGGRSNNVLSSISVSTIFPAGAVIVSTVGAGAPGGAGGDIGNPGLNGTPGNSSSITHSTTTFSTPGFAGGTGGVVLAIGGNTTGELGGTLPGSGGSGGNGRTAPGGFASPGLRGVDGRVFFTATPIFA